MYESKTNTCLPIVLLVLLLSVVGLPMSVGTALSALTHNSDQFACSLPGYVTQQDCTDNGGTWNPSRKWPGGWGVSSGQYGVFECSTCHVRNPPNGNIKRVRAEIFAPEGTFPGGAVDFKHVNAFGDDADDHDSSQRVCEVCHSMTSYHRFDVTGQLAQNRTHFNLADCIGCHRHNDGFRADCSACHGNSVQGTIWPDGNVANNHTDAYAWADDEAGSHATHVTVIGTGNNSCSTCHPGNPPVGHYEDSATGSEQAEVIRMDSDNDGEADFWKYLEGPTAVAGTAVYFKTAAGTDDADAYYRFDFSSDHRTCYNIDCHGGSELKWGDSNGCLICHASQQGSRAAVVGQFAANSHHVQGATLSASHCYQCHWEANSDGTINAVYHGGVFRSGAEVDLVIYGAGSRPTGYVAGTTAVPYVADGSRAGIEQINDHCLGCHSEQNSATQPFGDGKTPQQYAWDRNVAADDGVNDHLVVDVDGTSIASRYNQTATTTWGKYKTAANAAQKEVQKAFSAHGSAGSNAGGWDPATGIDGTITNTRANTAPGSATIACFDCHNSHGSTVSGRATSYNSATLYGGILKDTQSGMGGYGVTYRPAAGGSALAKNAYNPGAGLCFDCHTNQNGGGLFPWGYQSTFGASKAILGYFDAPDFSTVGSGSHARYPYKDDTGFMGGHFGASAGLIKGATHGINGLCTPCHDPHGTSPNLGADKQYAVPLLKGTWLSSPYKEDVAPASSGAITAAPQGTPRDFHIDQNTFGGHIMQIIPPGIQQDETQFAGLCLNCHPKDRLTVDVGVTGTPNSWQSKDRIHESVKGWKTSAGTVKHNYSCSKCHAPHGGTGLPRLMISNCLDWTHKGRVAYGTPVIQGDCVGGCDVGGGSGRHPGSYDYDDAWYGADHWEPRQASLVASCHEGKSGTWADQRWNQVTPWGNEPALTITSGPAAGNMLSSPSNPQVKATISWGTNLLSDSAVDFGLTASYGQTVANSSPTNAHALVLDGLTNHSTYHYRVRSRTYAGQSLASGNMTFYINVGPARPTLIDRGDKTCLGGGCSVTVAWNPTTDPDNGTIWYEIEYDTSSAFTSADRATTGWLPGTVSGASRTADIGPLATGTRWYWRVRARDNDHAGTESAWSTWDSFQTLPDYPTPSVPVLRYKSDATSCGIPANPVCTTTVSWNVSTAADPDLGPIEYSLEIDTDPAFTSTDKQVIAYPAGALTGSYFTATVGPLATDTTWYWHVKARYTSPVTRESAYSASGTFNTVFPPPTRPTNLTSSPDPVFCESGPCPSVLLNWQASSGAYGRDVKHLVEIDSVSAFNSADKQTFGPLDVGITSQLVSSLAINKTWYWRVRAQDAVYTKSLSSWSTVASFPTTPYPPPSTPTALFTPDAVCPTGCPVTLTWSASTAYNSGTVEYSVQVDDDPSFSSVDDSVSWTGATSWSTGALGLGTWYWQVQARDVDHLPAVSAWSNRGTFKVLAAAPPTKDITFTWANAPSNSISIDGALYGGTGSVVKTIATSFTAEIVGAPGQVGGGEPDAIWEYYAGQAPGGSPGYIAAVFTPNDGNSFTVKVGKTPAYVSGSGPGGGASYVAKDDATIMYAAGAGGGGGGEASFYYPWPEDYDEYGWDGLNGEGFGSATGGSGGAGSTSLSGPGAAGSPGGSGGAGSASVSPTTMTGDTGTSRVTITLN